MTDDTAKAEAPDIDAMSDEEFTAFKAGMRDDDAAEAAPVETKAEEPDKEPEKPVEQETKKEEFVPHGQFHRERERRKEAEGRAEKAMQRLTELLTASQPKQEQPQEQFPDPNDPIAKIEYVYENAIKAQEAEKQRAEQQRQQDEAARVWNEALGDTVRDWQEELAADPTLNDAYAYLSQSRGRELQAFGLAPHEVQRQLQQEEAAAIMHAHQTGRSYAAIVRGYATARGWQKPGPANEQPRDEAGRFAAAEQIDKREAARQASISLGGAGSATPTGAVTPKDLVDMSDEDFAAFKKKYGERAMQVAFGG